MNGIVLAGGSGTRLHPATLTINKQLLPVYDKPMTYYPISVLMLASIREILVISSPEHLSNYQRLLSTGEQFGVTFAYAVQPRPEWLVPAFIIGHDFISTDDLALVLGDNLFFGNDMSALLERARARARQSDATVFAYHVDYPKVYGVVTLDDEGRRPFLRQSGARHRRRGETLQARRAGATSVNQAYLERSQLHLEWMSRGYARLDTGTHYSLLETTEFVRVLQNRQDLQVACLKEIA